MEMSKVEFVKEFEHMRDFAELKAISSFSLEYPLTEGEFRRMMQLKKKILGSMVV